MRGITWLGFSMVLKLADCAVIKAAGQSEETHQQQLDYFGNLNILHSFLQDYEALGSNWTNPEYEDYDHSVIASLQDYVNSARENETYYDRPTGSGGLSHLKLLTKFCGPGNWSINGEVTQNPYFTQIDQCCKSHDECPDTVVERSDYENYPGLEQKTPWFTRLRCSCDAQFFTCLRDVSTFFAYAVAWIYSKVQAHCFEYEYPVLECKNSMYDGLISLPRCTEYLVDNSSPKQWQWFNVPHLSAKQACFPNTSYRYKLFWFVANQSKRKIIQQMNESQRVSIPD
ncbi:uncharacterized protein LOC6033765 [Culex quinquefasciatus]|uniref:uncharacterized protein LOC6033765 n=1 Tax=Culex quinquefasciatus TaxID=7176 RepID=UPI0018E29D1B|nr:uncharacterized protein LOC6033765 [Culex quinquefasciatus]